jgi:hypothetical protein
MPALVVAVSLNLGAPLPPLLPNSGELVVEANTDEVRQATVSPKYGALALQAPPPGATAAVPLVAGASGRCVRSPHCTKAAGHPGFCSGPKAAAAAAARQQAAARAAPQPGTSEASARGAAAHSASSGEEAATRLATPRAARGAAASTADFGCGGARLPEGLHEVAHIPTGLRLAKVLTAYDLTSRRVVMPVPEVEAGVPNAASTDLLTLAAVDESQRWHFPTLLAWTNVAGRRGYLLEGLAEMLANRGAREGDALLVFRDSDSQPPVRGSPCPAAGRRGGLAAWLARSLVRLGAPCADPGRFALLPLRFTLFCRGLSFAPAALHPPPRRAAPPCRSPPPPPLPRCRCCCTPREPPWGPPPAAG